MTQRLHLVFGGKLVDPARKTADGNIVGMRPDRAVTSTKEPG
jgi:hypothetical protein